MVLLLIFKDICHIYFKSSVDTNNLREKFYWNLFNNFFANCY